MVSLSVIIQNLIQLRRFPTHNVKIGKPVYGLPYIVNTLYSVVIIGKYCSFGRNCSIIPIRAHLPALKEHERFVISTFPITGYRGWKQKITLPLKRNFVIIGNDVWVGMNAIILSGVKIGNGAVIGAGAVVTKNVPDYAIVGGVPAKILRYRYTEEQRAELLKIAWWDWSDEKVKTNAEDFYGDVADFIQKFAINSSQKNEKIILTQ
jgi:acetyltransferase-like isoleucine patch superfamily enzyme